ncbi:MAG: alpha/beta hydrolase [Clostridia bacterium]|nr:alpha/beta hydrolase [Clostridia bacterium]
MKKLFKALKKACCVLLCLGFVSFFAAGNFIFSFTLLRESVFSRENVISLFNNGKKETSPTGQTWLEKNSKNLYLVSDDSVKLHALFSENNGSKKYAVFCHGYTGSAANSSKYARRFFEMGYNVLAVDARAHGESGGNIRGMGYLERRDIILWVKEIQKLEPSAQVVLFGVSMGGATVLFSSGEGDLPSCVKAVISDCAFTSVYDAVAVQFTAISGLPPFPLVDCASVVCEIRGNYSFSDASCVEAVKKSRTPTLFIHGTEDKTVPFYMLDEIFVAAECEKEKLVVEGAGHGQSESKKQKLYWETVEAFLRKHLD